MESQVVTCPQCGYEIPLSEAISHQIKEELQKEFNAKMGKQQKELEKREEELQSREQEIKDAQKAIGEEVAKKLAEEKAKLEQEAKEKAEEELELKMKGLEDEVKEKADKIKEMQQAELDLRKEQRKLKEDKEAFELDMARKLDEEKKELEKQLREGLSEEYDLKVRDYEEKNKALTAQINELKRKAEQGSQQAQGETLERQLEDDLKGYFSQDRIEPVSTGKRGADVMQGVCDGTGRECGTIIWEAKRTKGWSDGWSEKLKGDQREAGADIAVIVSIAQPKEGKGISLHNGVWVCDYASYIGLATALRSSLIEISGIKQAAVGKNEKMELLYDYLSGQGFRHRVEVLVEAFRSMHQDLEKERTAMQRIWKRREKQLQKVLDSTAGMYGEMQGIIGASMPELESLDLKALASGDDDDGDEEEGEIVD